MYTVLLEWSDSGQFQQDVLDHIYQKLYTESLQGLRALYRFLSYFFLAHMLNKSNV